EGTMVDGATVDSTIALSGNTFSSNSDGSQWIVEADIDPSIVNSVEAVVVTGAIKLRDGDMLMEIGRTVDAIFSVDMAGNGDWYARGDDPMDDDWAVQNGAVIAATGGPVLTGMPEAYGPAIFLCTGDTSGNYLIGGETDIGDADLDSVVVMNGDTLVARESDPVDLDGNGMEDDDTFIRSFSPNDGFIGPDGDVYLFVTLKNMAGDNLGDAFIRVDMGAPCPTDLDGDGNTGSSDLGILLGSWGMMNVPADLDGGGVGSSDLGILLGSWGPCP
ncbi:MAG: hypothetical protein VYC34_07270, partial [Planctomycetota bacterium]|nr:hypothetical protein [Planctomycetota bacterium]